MSSWDLVSRGAKVPVGIIGGSGLCTFSELPVLDKKRPATPYGFPSDDLVISEYEGQPLVFLPRHGSGHVFPPHRIPYKANLIAMRQLGVRHVVSSCVAGSLKAEIPPGSFVIPDQFVNLTWGRDDTWREGENFTHLPMGNPYCAAMRELLLSASRNTGVSAQDGGTIAVIQGPRFSTKAESCWFMRNGWDLVNMTQYPECYFARELGICYAVLTAVTDYDVGLPSALSMNPQNMDKILAIFHENVRMTKQILLQAAQIAREATDCRCVREETLEYYRR